MSDLLVSIQEELDTVATSQISRKKCTIYRVPKLLRRQNEDAFTPLQVSIGPFHRKNETLLLMECHKLEYLHSFLINHSKPDVLKTCLGVIKEKETQILECYAESIDMSSEDFVRMVLIDSIFIIEFLRSRVLPRPLDWLEVAHDMRLAENQLPFFILKDLYYAAFKPAVSDDDSTTTTTTFTDLACNYFGVEKSRLRVDPNTKEAEECCHFVDLLRSNYMQLQSLKQPDTNEKYYQDDILCPTAMSLYEAGVKFRVINSGNLLDISFNKDTGILTIPKLKVVDNTELWFRNMIAFEQCHNYTNNYLVDYLFFMDCLISTKEDVHLLANNGIIHSWIGSEEEVACLINSLGTHVHMNSPRHYYASITKQLNQHCKKRWNRYRATLMHTYFKHPWALISVIYAIILLILTIIQVVTGILAI